MSGRQIRPFATFIILLFFLESPSMAAGQLDLKDYLNQVETDNTNYQSLKSGETAGNLRSREYKLLYLPTLFGEYQNYRDARLTNNPQFMGSETKADSYSLGISQNFGIGLDAKLAYKYVDTKVTGAAASFFPQPHYIVASPVLELNQSLWRNFLGSETSAQKDLSQGSALALQYGQSFGQSQLKLSAESAYWRLATARKLLSAAKDNLGRAERIQSWSSRRSRLSLSDKSDLLQANATVAARKIDYEAALNEEKAAARDFNTQRGKSEDTVSETLETLEPEQISQLPCPERKGVREDVKAAEQEARAASASAKLSEEKAKPDVQVFATLSLNGRDEDKSKAIDQSFQSDYPMNVIGVRLNVPLSIGIASDTRSGYRAQAKSAEQNFKYKAFMSEKEWQHLSQRFDETKRQLKLATEMEKAQKSKIDYERDRYNRGRSTTYQVIMFEQDYASAQVARLNLEREILNLYAALKTYGDRP